MFDCSGKWGVDAALVWASLAFFARSLAFSIALAMVMASLSQENSRRSMFNLDDFDGITVQRLWKHPQKIEFFDG